MKPVPRAHVVVLAAFVLASVPACGEPPTKEDAEALLYERRLEGLDSIVLLNMDGGTAPIAPPSPAKASGGHQIAILSPQVDELACDRVDRKTYDCKVKWHVASDTPTTDRFRFLRADKKWSATPLDR